ncbi:hypothetical protein D3C79_1055820 [compost metagenome]
MLVGFDLHDGLMEFRVKWLANNIHSFKAFLLQRLHQLTENHIKTLHERVVITI